MTAATPGGVLVSTGNPPAAGCRVFRVERTVRLGDADEGGRLRLDALARHLQDVATDDYNDAGLRDDPVVWVVRRAAFRVQRWPRYLERLAYATFCGGLGPQWAERRTSAAGDAGGRLETSVLWASLNGASGRLAPIPARFAELWGVPPDFRPISARLLHTPPPADRESRPWELRTTDLDVLGHVNNAGHWEAVEDELARRLPGRIPVAAECEYRLPIDLADAVRVVSTLAGPSAAVADGIAGTAAPPARAGAETGLRPQPPPEPEALTLRVWLLSERGVHASAVVVTEPAD